MTTPRVVIVGGGFCGAALTALLARKCGGVLAIDVVDPRGLNGGTAFASSSAVHVLNVPASKMSLWQEDPLDFVRYAAGERPELVDVESAYLPRQLYGRYVTARVTDALRGADARVPVRVLRRQVTTVERQRAGGYAVVLDDGERLSVDAVVLALGPPHRAPHPGTLDPYDDRGLFGVAADARVAVLGAGLSAIDAFLTLQERGHPGAVTFISRHGGLPLPHRSESPGVGHAPWAAALVAQHPSVRQALRAVRARAAEPLVDWREVMDALRPHTNILWRQWSTSERRAFCRHVMPYFAQHRHRVAPEVARRVAEAVGRGEVRHVKAAAGGLTSTRAGWRVMLMRQGAASRLEADVVVDARGFDFEHLPSRLPVVHGLLRAGLARRAAVGGGLVVDEDGRVVHDRGSVPGLFAVGALLRGSLWETTAVPELRAQCAVVAEALVRLAAQGSRRRRLLRASDVR